MDADLAGIFAFVLIAATLVFFFATSVHRRTVAHDERKLELEARIEEAKARQARAPGEVQAHLEDRLRVLERIVTDPSADLSRQIEDLRERATQTENVQ